MGALHEGHLALVRQAKAECDVVAASVYVNRSNSTTRKTWSTTRGTRKRCPNVGRSRLRHAADAGGNELLQHLPTLKFELGALGEVLEGAHRPGHFMGVVQVVERLFHFVRPDVAYFGEKDRQQLAVVRSAAKQLHWPLQIIGCPTVRAATAWH
jgi:pantoate--beta-alanine ligase